MNVHMRITANKISEWYVPKDGKGFTIWSPYFERDYIRGMATDKLPRYRFENREFTWRFARLLGRAAAPNLIVGRCDSAGKIVFDDGDEVLILDASELPVDLIVADHTGAFFDCQSELAGLAPQYAEPVNRRAVYLPDPRKFTDIYLEELLERFCHIQAEYRRRRKAFDTLFKHRSHKEPDIFPLHWEDVLARLERTDPQHLAQVIRAHISFS
jgi:hypothetical protein